MSESNLTAPTDNAAFHRFWIAGVIVASLAAWAMLSFAPIQIALRPELSDVTMYSPPELQAEYAEVVPWVTWQNCLLRFAFAGLALGLVTSLFVAIPRADRRGTLLAAGTVGGLAFGTLAGQVGWSLRSLLNSPSALAKIEEPIFRDTLLFLVVSTLLSGALWVVYVVGRRGPAGQQGFSVFLGGALAGLLLPLAAAVFPGMSTHVFPTEGLGLPGVWFGMLAVLVAFFPLLTGPRPAPAAVATESATVAPADNEV